MRNSTWYALTLAAFGLTTNVVGCSGDDDAAEAAGGSSTKAGSSSGGKTSSDSGGKTSKAGSPTTNPYGGSATNPYGGSDDGSAGGAPGGAPSDAGAAGEPAAAAGAGGEQASTDVELHATAAGNVFTDSRGFSLYVHKGDMASTTPPVSTCIAGCVTTWPLFYVKTPSVGAGLLASDFGIFKRPDGEMQSTYKGWPLYFFANDLAPGDIKGDGVGTVWFLAKLPFVGPK